MVLLALQVSQGHKGMKQSEEKETQRQNGEERGRGGYGRLG